MGLLNTTQYGILARDPRPSGTRIALGNQVRMDSGPGTFGGFAPNPFARNAVISEVAVTRATTKTPPADGESIPRVYDVGITDIPDRTYTCYWDDDPDEKNPAVFFQLLMEQELEVRIEDYPDMSTTNDRLRAHYNVTYVKQTKEGGGQQMLEVGLQFNGNVFDDTRV